MRGEDSMSKTWVKEKIQRIKKKTSIGDSRLSNGSGTNKRKTRKKYRGQGKWLTIHVAGSMSNNSLVVLALSQKTDMSFEKGLAELERIVAKLESSDVDLETAVADFEQGMKIQQYCKNKLDEATLQVNRLLQDGKLSLCKIFLIIKQRVLNNLLTQMIL